MIKVLRMDFCRMLVSWQFFVAVIGIAVVSTLNSLNFISGANEDIILIFASGDAPFFSIVILILETLPYGTAFCNDWENRYIRSIIMRSSPIKYAVSKVISCFMGALLAGLLGRLLFAATAFPFLNPVNPTTNSFVSSALNHPEGAQWFLANGHYFTWILIESLERSLQGSIYATFSLFLSTKITNIFITLAMPVIAYYMYLNIANFIGFPNFLLMTAVFENDGIFPDNLLFGVFYALFYAVLFSMLFGHFFEKSVKGRLENG